VSRKAFPILLLLALVGCPTNGGDDDMQEPPYSSEIEIARIELTPTYVKVGASETADLLATAIYEDGAAVDVTAAVDWIVPDEYADIVSVDDGVVEVLGIGMGQVYATLGTFTSNLTTVEAGHFSFAVTNLHYDGVDHAATATVPQGSVVQVYVEVSGRELPSDAGDVLFEIEGLLPFGADRQEQGLDPYFYAIDDSTFRGIFVVAPSAEVGSHAISLTVEGLAGETDDSMAVSAHGLPEDKTCAEITTETTLEEFRARKYRVEMYDFPVAYRILAEAEGESTLDTALWLFNEDGSLFTWTDNPPGAETDAALPMGITDALEGVYYLMMTASPYAATTGAESGEFRLSCDTEIVSEPEFRGDTGTDIPSGVGPVTLEIDVTGLPPGAVIDQAWVHADVESDVPNQVTIVLDAPNLGPSAGLRSTGHYTERLAVTWGDLVDPDTSYMSYFQGADPDGIWTLTVEDHSEDGQTTVHDWRLYLTTN